MTYVRHVTALALVLMTWTVAMPAAQEAAAPAKVTLTPAQMETFLRRAKVVRTRDVGTGVTNTRRATLSDGVVTHDAQIQIIDQTLRVFQARGQDPELNFRDTYLYNIAAYRLAVLLGMDNVPMSVERAHDGKVGSFTWWIDDVMMDEGARQKQEAIGPDAQRTSMQVQIMYAFDELIQNRDRNLGNLLWTTDWKMWMIDHTRAFRRGRELLKPALLTRTDRAFLQSLRRLTREDVRKSMERILTPEEIDAVMTRRDRLVKLFDARIAERGEDAVLFSLTR